MLKKIKNLLCSLFPSAPSQKNHGLKEFKEGVNSTNTSTIDLHIEWEDLSKGEPNSKTNSIICNAMKRNGIYGYVTECLLVTDEGKTYMPQQLSDHWEAFIFSKKFKPKTITYLPLD